MSCTATDYAAAHGLRIIPAAELTPERFDALLGITPAIRAETAATLAAERAREAAALAKRPPWTPPKRCRCGYCNPCMGEGT